MQRTRKQLSPLSCPQQNLRSKLNQSAALLRRPDFMTSNTFPCRNHCAALIFLLTCALALATDNPPPEATAADIDRIAKLINQLGADDFGAREKAQSEL